jgi:hypothetical protein
VQAQVRERQAETRVRRWVWRALERGALRLWVRLERRWWARGWWARLRLALLTT